MRKLAITIGLLAAAVTYLGTAANGQQGPAEPRSFATVGMRIKLDFAKDILSGLATNDFKVIRENTKALQGMNAIEDFARGETPGYRSQLRLFRSATDELARAAEAESLDGATLAFTQMTISCVSCHKELRKKLN